MKNQILAFILGIVIAICGNVIAQSISTLGADIIIANTSMTAPTITATSAIGSPAIAATGTNTFIGSVASTGISGTNNTIIGQSAGSGITTGNGNTLLGGNIAGLAAGLTNNIILANGTGAIKAQNDGTNWTLTGIVNGSTSAWTKATAGDVASFTNGGGTPSPTYIYSGSNTAGMSNGPTQTGEFVQLDAANHKVLIGVSSGTISAASATGLATTGVLSATTGGAANAATCWKADGITLGHCTSVVAAGGTCTCV